MTIRQQCLSMIALAEHAFVTLENAAAPPKLVKFRNETALRFVEKAPQQMLLLKFARIVSRLHSLDLLISRGLIQEVGVIMRTLDEAEEDVQCIALALIQGRWEPIQAKLSEYFWQEEFAEGETPARSLPRGMVDRAKVRAWITRAGGITNTSLADSAGRTVHKSMSGYVHSAASHVMDMYTGHPLRFAIRGVTDPVMLSGYVNLVLSYMYRGTVASYFVITATLGHEAAQPYYEAIKQIEKQVGGDIFPEKTPRN